MKKYLFLIIVSVCIYHCVSCSSGGGEESVPVSKEDFEPITLRYATQHSIDHAAHKSANAIKEYVEKNTDGRVKITIYPSNQLGDWTQVYDEIMFGTIDIAHTSVPESYDPRITAAFLPYLAGSYEQLEDIIDSDSYLTKKMKEFQSAFNIEFFGFYAEGFSGIGVSKELKNPEETKTDKGVLVRVPGIDSFKLPTEYIGFRTSTIPYADTFTAIQTGVVDGWQGGPPNLNYLNFRDAIKYYYHYKITHEATQIYMNKDVFNKLLAEDQEVLRDAIEMECAASIKYAREEDDKYMQLLRDYGIEVIEFEDEVIDNIAFEVRENVWKSLEKTYTKEFFDELKQSY